MTHHFDTIAAISTAIGQGGIAIIRLSGPESVSIAGKLFRPAGTKGLAELGSHRMTYGHIVDPADGGLVDEVLIVTMRAPHSYTREDVVEINSHGGIMAAKRIIGLCLRAGARMAEPGEFTKRAFLNGRLNLSEAEAVSDLINAGTEESMRIAGEQLRGSLTARLSGIREQLVGISAFVEAHIDFPEDEIDPAPKKELEEKLSGLIGEIKGLADTFNEGRFFREGLSLALVGRPNVGKSSLLNALLQKDRAIVTELPGTTRDLIEDYLNIEGLPVRIMDTAGIRSSDERIEQEGIRRSMQAIEDADCIIALFDGSEPLKEEDRDLLQRLEGRKVIAVISKADLPRAISFEGPHLQGRLPVSLSVVTGEGIGELKKAVLEQYLRGWNGERQGVVVTNIRHKTALDGAVSSLEKARELLSGTGPLELFSIEAREALDRIGEITGAITTDEILQTIFGSFCIGK